MIWAAGPTIPRGMSCMSDIEFFDTNILIYAFDRAAGSKHEACKRLVQEVFTGARSGAISGQVLAEFYSVLSSKFSSRIPPQEAAAHVESFAASPRWRKVEYTSSTVSRAAMLCGQWGAPFWDSLIAQTMIENGILVIHTDNKKDFGRIPGLRVRPIE